MYAAIVIFSKKPEHADYIVLYLVGDDTKDLADSLLSDFIHLHFGGRMCPVDVD